MPKAERVRVEPTHDDYRKFLKHPKAGGFPESGSAEWPKDRFTHRRIADGSVKIASAPQGEHATTHGRAANPQQQPRPHRTEANRTNRTEASSDEASS
jgi:hypothetical protein